MKMLAISWQMEIFKFIPKNFGIFKIGSFHGLRIGVHSYLGFSSPGIPKGG